MKKFATLFTLAILTFATNIFSHIIETPDLTLIEKELNDLDENCLVVFDVDDTLIMPEDQILRVDHFNTEANPIVHQFWERIKLLDEQARQNLISKIFLTAKRNIIDEKVLDLIDNLKKKNVKVIALTALTTGKFGHIERLEDWRIHHLRSMGIDFHPSAPHSEEIIFDDVNGIGTKPVFKEGIIASSRYPKGQVLVSFLNKIEWKPKKIIFVDDYINFINSVETELTTADIDHICFHYTATDKMEIKLDMKVVQMQCDHLLEHHEWLSDEEALQRLSEKEMN